MLDTEIDPYNPVASSGPAITLVSKNDAKDVLSKG